MFDITNLNQSGDSYYSGLSNLNNFQGGSASSAGSSDITKIFSGALQAFQGLTMMNDSIDMIKQGADFQAGVYRASGQAALQGAQFQAAVFRQSGQAALMTANYNIAIDQFQTNRQDDALGVQMHNVLSSNYASAGSSGISIGSKSTMLVQSSIVGNAEKQSVQMFNDAQQRQGLIQYQGALANMQFENQARAAEYSGAVAVQEAENNARAAHYQGQVDAYKAEVQRADSIGSSFTNLFQSFGG